MSPPAEPPISKMEAVRRALKAEPHLTTKELLERTGCHPAHVRDIKRKLRAAGVDVPQQVNQSAGGGPPREAPTTLDVKGMEAVASSCNPRIRTLDDLLRATRVDLAVWEVERHVINKYEMGSIPRAVGSDKRGWRRAHSRPQVTELFQIKVWLRRIAPQQVGLKAALTGLLRDLRRNAPPARPAPYRKAAGDCLAEIDQPDLHLGKLAWAAETGEDYDVRAAEAAFKEGIARHREASAVYGIARFLLPIGNDFLNVDNAARTTTAGTPQDEDGRWQRSYTRGFALLRWTVDYLLEVAPVDVVQVGGNHDFERGFYLAHALECIYERHPRVSIDNAPTVRKYYAFGNSLIGFTHGDKELTKDLPLTMAVEQPKLWAAARFREFHCGHLHHQREHVFQPVLEEKGVVVRHLSSLTAADAWHAAKGYRAQRASSCFIRHPEMGLLAELKFNLITRPPGGGSKV